MFHLCRTEEVVFHLGRGDYRYYYGERNVGALFNSSYSAGQQKLCFIWGGETTVTIMGNGLGGRCQELALAALISLG